MNYRNLLVLMLLWLAMGLGKLHAQALPDTSLNTVIPDSLAEKRGQEVGPPPPIVPQATDTVSKKGPYQPVPKKSAMYSAIFPGMGQLNNHQYWKMGVIYAAAGVGVYYLVDNTTNYQKYRKAYVSRLSNPNYQDQFTPIFNASQLTPLEIQDQLNQEQAYYKQYLDLTYLISGVGYALQVLDALIYAHLKNFDVSKDISMRITPAAVPNGVGAGIGIVFNYKYR